MIDRAKQTVGLNPSTAIYELWNLAKLPNVSVHIPRKREWSQPLRWEGNWVGKADENSWPQQPPSNLVFPSHLCVYGVWWPHHLPSPPAVPSLSEGPRPNGHLPVCGYWSPTTFLLFGAMPFLSSLAAKAETGGSHFQLRWWRSRVDGKCQGMLHACCPQPRWAVALSWPKSGSPGSKTGRH